MADHRIISDRRLLRMGLALAAPTLVLSGAVAGLRAEPAPRAHAESTAPRAADPATRGSAREEGSAGTALSGAPRPDTPRRVVVPSLGVRADVSPIRLEGGALTPPSDPSRVGWWQGGSRPGSGAGAAVLTGHTVHTGGGAFDDLEALRRGDRVVVEGVRGRLVYEVSSVQVLSKAELARRSASLFARSGAARLVLVTCEDWDGAGYLSNVVVTARPAG